MLNKTFIIQNYLALLNHTSTIPGPGRLQPEIREDRWRSASQRVPLCVRSAERRGAGCRRDVRVWYPGGGRAGEVRRPDLQNRHPR